MTRLIIFATDSIVPDQILFMKWFNIIFVVIFILFAVVQYNDPDPWLWIALYLYGAILCYLAIRKQSYHTLNFLGIGIYAVYAFYLFFSNAGVLSWISDHNSENIAESMQATKPWIEKTREFFGLIILLFVVIFNMVVIKRQERRMDNNKSNE